MCSPSRKMRFAMAIYTALNINPLHTATLQHGLSSPARPPAGGGGERGGACPPQSERGGGADEARARLYPDYSANNNPSTLHLCPGHDPDPTSARCGDVHHAIICRSNQDHYHRDIPHTCGKPGCPVCWPTWATRATRRAAGRVQGYLTATRTKYRPRHVTFSPPPGRYQEPREVLEAFQKVVNVSGARALALVVHPYRFRGGMKARAWEEARAAAFRGNPYEWALSREAWADYLEASPHLHALVYGYLLPSDEFEHLTGWVYKNLGIRKSLEATIRYLLTHAWVRGNAKAIRYWRGMSTRNLGCTVKIEHVTKQCPVCHEDLGRVAWGEDYQDLRNAPTARFVMEIREYWVRNRAITLTKLNVNQVLTDVKPIPDRKAEVSE